MLTGKELGAAIEAARLKKAVSKKQLANDFGVTPPSIQDWVRRGTIDKERLPKLWAYFADVVGPTHWGLTGEAASLMEIAYGRRSLSLAEALPVIALALRSLSGARLTMARAALHQLVDHPEMLDDVDSQVVLLIETEASPTKRTGTGA